MDCNILVDELPQSVDGISLHTDFRNYILLELLMCDNSIDAAGKFARAVDLVFAQPVPTVEWAVEKLLWFYRCGKEQRESSGSSSKTEIIAYDFQVDDRLILAAFFEAYGIDLNEIDYLHWWKFQSLFSALPETCRMYKIMQYRTVDLNTLKGSEKKHYAKMQARYKINRNRMPRETLSVVAREAEEKARIAARYKEAQEWKQRQLLKSS